MSTLRFCIFISLSFFGISTQAQNLINNSSFDDYSVYLDSNKNIVYQPNCWFYGQTKLNHPIYFSSDMYLKSVKLPNHPVYFSSNMYLNKYQSNIYHPDSSLIKQGQKCNYISLLILPNTQIAYTMLSEPLQVGHKYQLKVDVKPYDQSTCISDLLVGFNDCPNCSLDSNLYQLRLTFPDSVSRINYFSSWHTLRAEFIAKRDERVFIISAGSADDYIKIIDSNRDKYLIYDKRWSNKYRLLYFVDNITLTEIDSKQDSLFVPKYDSLDVGESIILQNIYFDFDKFDLLKESYPALIGVAEYLNRNKNTQIKISGYTDNVGTDDYNDNLSKLRAKSVIDYLASLGIARDRLQSEGFGAKLPIDSNDTEEGRRRNRRIEMKVIKK